MKKEEIAKLFNISRQTLNNWEKDKPELFKIIEGHFEKEKEVKDCNDVNYLKDEIFKALDKLPENQVKMYFHLIMAELAKNGH
ncbi:MAG: hypothetical protein COB67_08925 [SAR324 cluster bacterium]|uniref:Uncharacterized protein n=1 Tax=SAR324 cluster bacterium TaxID=2024889 RepID=A0A2A4T2P4_9DELT|nr:MAG: hypothetical protein COB67_08925 [SAR324 cluster bacterium]